MLDSPPVNIYSFNLCFIALPAETIVAYRGGLDYKLLCTKLICASICIYKLISWAPGSPLVRTRGGRVFNQFYPAGFGLKTDFKSIKVCPKSDSKMYIGLKLRPQPISQQSKVQLSPLGDNKKNNDKRAIKICFVTIG